MQETIQNTLKTFPLFLLMLFTGMILISGTEGVHQKIISFGFMFTVLVSAYLVNKRDRKLMKYAPYVFSVFLTIVLGSVVSLFMRVIKHGDLNQMMVFEGLGKFLSRNLLFNTIILGIGSLLILLLLYGFSNAVKEKNKEFPDKRYYRAFTGLSRVSNLMMLIASISMIVAYTEASNYIVVLSVWMLFLTNFMAILLFSGICLMKYEKLK